MNLKKRWHPSEATYSPGAAFNREVHEAAAFEDGQIEALRSQIDRMASISARMLDLLVEMGATPEQVCTVLGSWEPAE